MTVPSEQNPVDLYVLGDVDSSQKLSLSINQDAYVAEGAVVAAQKFFLRMFTRKGSDPISPSRGTDFLTNLKNGRLQSEPAIAMAFAASAQDAINQLSKEISDDTYRADEEVFRVTVKSVKMTASEVAVQATMETQSGGLTEVAMPFTL